jgi:type II secretory pathway component PulF
MKLVIAFSRKALITGTTPNIFTQSLCALISAGISLVVPVIRALREKAMTIQAETMDSIDRKLPNLSERERTVIFAFSRKALITGTTPNIFTQSLCALISAGISLEIASAAII